jgi:hypothetical protein
METSLRVECGHEVPLVEGTRMWCYYDCSFGVLMDPSRSFGWYDFVMDGSPYKGRGSRGYYDAQRLACVECGLRDLARRQNDKLTLDTETWELTR